MDYVVEVAGNKEFGSIFLQKGQQQENIALTIVQSGWAKVWMHICPEAINAALGSWHAYPASFRCRAKMLVPLLVSPLHSCSRILST